LLQALQEYEGGKIVVFIDHSMGGGIASLAMLWMLNSQQQPGKPKFVFCITFGFPLIGNGTLARIVRCKGWTDQFCHVVLGHDVFSRVLLAPCISVPSFKIGQNAGFVIMFWGTWSPGRRLLFLCFILSNPQQYPQQQYDDAEHGHMSVSDYIIRPNTPDNGHMVQKPNGSRPER
jgi:hypothetical protein